jgi:hypothetical protein
MDRLLKEIKANELETLCQENHSLHIPQVSLYSCYVMYMQHHFVLHDFAITLLNIKQNVI